MIDDLVELEKKKIRELLSHLIKYKNKESLLRYQPLFVFFVNSKNDNDLFCPTSAGNHSDI